MGRCLTPGLESVQCPWRTMSNSNEVEIKPLEAVPYIKMSINFIIF